MSSVKIETYLAEFNTRFSQDANILVPASLSGYFSAIKRRSESEVVEHGCHLMWLPEESTLRGGPVIDGLTHEKIDLKLSSVKYHKFHCGDFHVHPYEGKFGAEISIGPSGADGDWLAWWSDPPQKQKFGLHFVASGTDLFLVIIPKDRATPHPLKPSKTYEDGFTKFLNEDEQMAFAEMCAALIQNKKDIARAKGKSLVNAARSTEEENDMMNIELANKNKCRYYRGELNGAGTKLKPMNRLV